MLSKLSRLGVILIVAGLVTACASNPFYHKNFMRGQVVSISDSVAVVCIGSYNNDLVGKTLSVYRVVFDYGQMEGAQGFSREYAGSLRIGTIINEHFARAEVIDGAVAKNDMVELSQ